MRTVENAFRSRRAAFTSKPEPARPLVPTRSNMFSLRPKAIDFNSMWAKLEPSIIDIITLQPITNKQWNFMFGDIYEICVAIPDPLTERLYHAVKEALEKHAGVLYLQLSQQSTSDLLPEYHKLWRTYYDGASYVHLLFRYLNRQFIRTRKASDAETFTSFQQYIPQPDTKEIGSLALDIWKDKVMKPLLPNLVSLLLNAILDDRRGKALGDDRIVAGVIQSFVQVEESFGSESHAVYPSTYEFYRQSFESRFLDETKIYYGQLADQLLESLECSSYMKMVIEKLEEEEQRTRRFCPTVTLEEAKKICQEVMIAAHKERLYAVVPDLIEKEMREDLHNMYRLLRPLPAGINMVVAEFEAYVKRKGHEAVTALQGDTVPQQFVEQVLSVHEKYSAMKDEVFMGDGDFSGALDKALQAVVNTRSEARGSPPKASERLARYTDMLLRKSVKGLSETEIESSLSKAIVIFRYIEDKDVFQKYYSRMLSSRLIHGASVSMDAEELMITKLKNACGYEFTSKLMRMFTDIGLSKEQGNKFKDYITTRGINVGVSMTPFILQAGAWPISPSSSSPSSSSKSDDPSGSPAPGGFALPRELQPCVQAFQEYYVSSHNGRKLTWLYHLSTADVKLNYADKPYIVVMTVHQMALMFCFEAVDQQSVADLQEQTKLSGETLLKNVKALVESGLLALENKAEQLGESSTLVLNKGVTNRKIKFKVSAPQIQRTAEKETEAVNTTVQQDRKYYMECAIVRIMKTRKVLRHAMLVGEVIEQTKGRFTPDLPFIKKSIEDLIEKLYLQRTDSHDEYQYLA